MRKSGFTESQIVAILKEGEAGPRIERADEEARDQPCDLLQLASEVRRGERLGPEENEGARGGERQAQTHVRGAGS
jgi:hypothetical protein